MSWLIAKILAWLSAGALDRILSGLRDVHDDATERQRIEAAIVKKHIDAEIARRQAQREIALAGMAHPAWWLGWLLFVLPTGVYYLTIIADSIFQFRWNIAALPEPYAGWAQTIVTALFLGQGAIGVAQSLHRR